MRATTSGTPSAVTKGTSQLTGYITLDLDEAVTVHEGGEICGGGQALLPR